MVPLWLSLFVSVGAGCSCDGYRYGSSKDDFSENMMKTSSPLRNEYNEIVSKLVKAQDDIYSLVSENLMLFYKQVRRNVSVTIPVLYNFLMAQIHNLPASFQLALLLFFFIDIPFVRLRLHLFKMLNPFC
jgi:hypothetical protein